MGDDSNMILMMLYGLKFVQNSECTYNKKITANILLLRCARYYLNLLNILSYLIFMITWRRYYRNSYSREEENEQLGRATGETHLPGIYPIDLTSSLIEFYHVFNKVI